MKRGICAALTLLLALSLLCGCSSTGDLVSDLQRYFQKGERAAPTDEAMPRFEDIPYERPDVDALQQRVDELEAALHEGKRLKTVKAILEDCYADYYHFVTMYNLAYIRSCQDLTDRYYAEEYAWCDEQIGTVGQIMEDMYYICGTSELAKQLEESFFWEGFSDDYGNAEEAIYDDELIALFQEESVLMTHYRTLMANPMIENLEGEDEDLYSRAILEDESGYYDLLMQFYNRYNEEASAIYIELVKVRQQQAKKLGYENYEQMAYDYVYDRDYSPEQATAYLEEIKTWLVPLYVELDGGWDLDYSRLSTTRLKRALGAGAERMGGVIAEAYQFMDSFDLWDVEARTNKAETSFQDYLADYEAPFLFLDADRDMKDLMNASHEFGHYVDAYANYNATESVDVSETFSQAMEYLMPCYLEDVLKDAQLEELYLIKMQDTLELYAQQGSFAEFEHIVYNTEPEELSAEFLNELHLKLSKEYGYYDGYSRDYYAKSWIDISHFFDSPFYVIAYPVSNDIAMQIYELEQQEPGAGLEKYLEILPREYGGLIDTVTAGGLESPFTPGRLEKVTQDLRERLEADAAAA